jgi:2-polyprenyl-3-methyl-5-hydroxy-6-metoxy-1,4-benzoquinol methylase
MTLMLESPTAARAPLRIQQLPSGKRRISFDEGMELFGAPAAWETAYPRPLIEAIYETKGPYVCDEIMRDEDPRYVENSLRNDVFSYVPPQKFDGARLLDFGCGSGASSMVLSRLLPRCEIVGVELEERLLRLAELRARYLGKGAVRFLQSPAPDRLPAGLGTFDYVICSAVYEHMLPEERAPLLRLMWRHMAPGAVLFLNQTPHRYFPVEMHTTYLPLINYMPDALAWRYARLSKRVPRGATWSELLRAGVRGTTIGEVLGVLRAEGRPALLDPLEGDRIDVWHSRLSARHAALKGALHVSLKALRKMSGIELVPDLALAIRKDG